MGVFYSVYTPKGYKPGQRLPMVIMFGSSTNSKANMTKLKPSLDRARWMGVVCGMMDSSDHQKEFLDTIIRDIPHTRLYLAATSCGISRVFNITAKRTDTFHGILSFCNYSTRYLNNESYCSGMMVAFLTSEFSARSDERLASQTRALTKSGCKVRQFTHAGYGGPTKTSIDDAIDWAETDVNERETTYLKGLYKKKKYSELYRKAAEWKALDTPRRPQCKYSAELIPLLERKAKRQLESIQKSKTVVSGLRWFIENWGPNCPSSKEAQTQFNTIGEGLAKGFSNSKTPLKTLKSFADDWKDQPFAKPVMTEFNRRGEAYYGRLSKSKPSSTALLKFAHYWDGCACILPAQEKLEAMASRAANKLLRSNSTTARQLTEYMKRWKGFESVKDIEAKYKEMAFEELEAIKAIDNKFSKRLRLQKFIKNFSNGLLVKKAKIMLTEL